MKTRVLSRQIWYTPIGWLGEDGSDHSSCTSESLSGRAARSETASGLLPSVEAVTASERVQPA